MIFVFPCLLTSQPLALHMAVGDRILVWGLLLLLLFLEPNDILVCVCVSVCVCLCPCVTFFFIHSSFDIHLG